MKSNKDLIFHVAMQRMADDLDLQHEKLYHANEALCLINGMPNFFNSQEMQEVNKLLCHKNVLVNKPKNGVGTTLMAASISGFDKHLAEKIIISRISKSSWTLFYEFELSF